ncbi:hypothetical protein SLEP1_g53079 [Rubroshorea leprosula]|uniref:Peptidase C14 caspase domain-containing protein n=1 Tax=Rubroshorea leprosula TaxID=152421 RepID=A0AAV5M9E4_9ROSI|nr:hypothetical protein SLEP1_g53079 [Rubroshorea leprosula]
MLAMKNVLVKRFGFDDAHIKHLTDAPGSSVMPTSANIKAALDQIVYKDKVRDILFFHYSGHGTRIPSVKHGHPFRQDEDKLDSMFSKLDESILLNGFQANETFVNVSESEGRGKASRVFSNAVQMVLKENLGLLSNKEVVMMAKKVLQA